MRRFHAWGVASACALSGCLSVDSDDAEASLHIDEAALSATTVNDGETFEFSWKVSHTKAQGYVTQVGLYVGSERELATGADRDRLALFSRAVTGEIQNDAAEATITCSRSGNRLSCEGALREAPASEAVLTLRACTSYVLSDEEDCEFRAFTLSLP